VLTLTVSFDTDAYGGLCIRPTLENTGEEPVSFSTSTGALFSVRMEYEGQEVWRDARIATQAVVPRTLDPGDTRTQQFIWPHPDEYDGKAADIGFDGLTDERLADADGADDRTQYDDGSLVAVVTALGTDLDPVQEPVPSTDEL
jgi:hypothetical protein